MNENKSNISIEKLDELLEKDTEIKDISDSDSNSEKTKFEDFDIKRQIELESEWMKAKEIAQKRKSQSTKKSKLTNKQKKKKRKAKKNARKKNRKKK